MIVARQSDHERDENGFLWSEVTDPANEHAFVGSEKPSVNWAAKARLDATEAYYRKYDKKNAPVNRNGHIFRVTKKPKE